MFEMAVWRDTKCIAILSSKHGGRSESTVSRNSKHSNGHHVKVDVPVPLAVCFLQ